MKNVEMLTTPIPAMAGHFTLKKVERGVRSFIPSNHPYIQSILEMCNQNNAEVTLKRGMYNIKW